MFMKIGVIISMYDEYDNVTRNIQNINKNLFPIIVVQSDPKDSEKIIDSNLVNYYKKFPDIMGTGNIFTDDASKAICHPISRNLNHAFNATNSFDVDWWIVLFGDVELYNFNGIIKIINKMNSQNKSLGQFKTKFQIPPSKPRKLRPLPFHPPYIHCYLQSIKAKYFQYHRGGDSLNAK